MRQNRDQLKRKRVRQSALATLLLAGLLATTGCNHDSTYRYWGPTVPSPVVPPTGPVVTQSRTVQGFSGVTLTGVGQVIIEQGPAESLTITTKENLLPHLTSEVLGDSLMLGMEPGFNVSSARDILFRVTLPRLERVQLSGVGDFDITGIDMDRFSAELSGVGAIRARGRVDHQVIELSGVGDYRAAELRSRVATVRIHGQTHAVVRVSELLQGTVQYLCSLSYYGNPEVDVAGNGRVHRMGP